MDSFYCVEMLKFVIQFNLFFKLELVEMEREGFLYIFDIVFLLKQCYLNDQLFFIIGVDMIEYLLKWYKLDELLNFI